MKLGCHNTVSSLTQAIPFLIDYQPNQANINSNPELINVMLGQVARPKKMLDLTVLVMIE